MPMAFFILYVGKFSFDSSMMPWVALVHYFLTSYIITSQFTLETQLKHLINVQHLYNI